MYGYILENPVFRENKFVNCSFNTSILKFQLAYRSVEANRKSLGIPKLFKIVYVRVALIVSIKT